MTSKQVGEPLKLISLNASLDGTTSMKDCFRDICKNQYRNFRVLKVYSPDEFYLEYVTSSSATSSTYDKLQDFYNDKSHRENYRLRTPIAHKGRIYVWHDPVNGTWNRVRVLSIDHAFRMVEAFSLDQDVNIYASFEELIEMNADFYSWSPWAIRGFLPDVRPPEGLLDWPAQTISVFKNMCHPEKIFHGVVLERGVIQSEGLGTHHESQVLQPQLCLGLLLIEKSPKVVKSVQDLLLEQGLAVPAATTS